MASKKQQEAPYCIVRFVLNHERLREIMTWLTSNGYPCLVKLSTQKKWTKSRKASNFFNLQKAPIVFNWYVDIKLRRDDALMLRLFEPQVVQHNTHRHKYHPSINKYHPSIIKKRYRINN